MNKTIASKTGKEFVVREPKEGDVEELLEYINTLVEEDVPILVNEKQTLEQEKRWLKDTLEAIEKGKKVVLLAFDGDRLVGNTQIEKDRWKSDHVGKFGISLKKGYRGEGLGTQLTAMVIEEAKDKLGIIKVVLEVFANNPCGLGLYKKLGFKECGKIPGGVKHRGEFVDRMMMYKDLT